MHVYLYLTCGISLWHPINLISDIIGLFLIFLINQVLLVYTKIQRV